MSKFNTLHKLFIKIKTMKYFIMSSPKLCLLIMLISIMIFSTYNNCNAQIESATNDSQTIETPLGRFDISTDKIYNYRINSKENITINLKIKGKNAKHIKGFRLTELSASNNGQKLETRKVSGLNRLFKSSFSKRKDWHKPIKRLRNVTFKSDDTYYIQDDTYYVPGVHVNTSVSSVDIKGKLELLVASEENKCACKVENFIEQPTELVNRVFEFNGDTIKFIEEPTYTFDEETTDLSKHTFGFLLEDPSELLFDIYIEDANGKAIKSNLGRGLLVETIPFELRYREKPEKGYKLVIVYDSESCKVTIPFELKNITRPK